MPEAGRTAARFDKRGIVFCAIAGALLLTAGAAWATSSHDPWKLREVRIGAVLPADAMGQCENCHTLDITQGEPLTSYIDRNARTLPQMRAFGGVPVSFGCTFCHTTVTDNVYMQNALKDYEFTVATRKHPVGVTVGGVENTNEYFSTFDGTAQVDQLQCMDCHDAGLLNPGGMGSYPYHEGRTTDAAPWTGTWNKAVNPYGLKNVAALGDERANHCVNTCHGNLGAANGATKPRMGHLGWGGYSGTTMYEPRGQALLQGNCGVCHDAHSSTQDGLMGDGLASQTTGVNPAPPPDLLKTPETAVTMSDCTLTCHVGRAAASEFRTVGHGKARNREDTANIGHSYTLCTPCHTSAVSHRDPVNPKRFSFTEDTSMAVLSHDGAANGLDDDYDGQVDEADEATWTQPAVSICQGCHAEYYAHSGAIAGAAPSNQSASCLDCHDPHGKGVGANIEMVRTTIAGEATTYQNAADMAGADDFYRGLADRSGVCDNTACHGRDLAAILADTAINEHTGVLPGDNCAGCHIHKSPTPAPSFRPKCDVCHGYPPANGGLPDYSQGIGVHERHVTNLAIECEECHYRNAAVGNTHNEANWSEPTGIPVPRTYIDVVFNTHGGTVNMNATYSGYNVGTGTMDGTIGAVHTCNNVTCHNPDSSTAGTGLTGKAGAATNNVVSWADAFTPISACTGCHAESPNTNPDGGSHYKHDNSTGGKGFPCQMCHSPYYDATGTFGTAAGAHGNWAINATGIVNINGTLGAQAIGGTFDDGTNACSNVYCHGTTLGAGGDQPLPVWGPGVARSGGLCGDCHDADPTTDTVAPQDTISTGNHVAHLNAPQGPSVTCAACHPAYAANAVSHVNGGKDFLNVDDTTVTTMTLTDTCNNCHGTSVANAKNATNWATGTFRLGCLECHDGSARSARTGGVIAPQENLYWTTTGHGRPGTTYNATLHGQPGPGYLCTVCHNEDAAHISGTLGDTERFRSVADDALDYTSDTSEVCLDCHKVGQAAAPPPVNHLGRDAQAEASVHSGALTGNYNTAAKAAVAFPAYGNAAGYAASPGYQCEACHNPHGTTKLAMVKDTLNGAFGDAVAVPVGAAFDSGSATLAGLDPTLGANDGACDACHRASGNTNAHPDSAAGKANNHNYGQTCVNCHDHQNSFYAGCSDCHGGSLVGATRRNYWPDGAVGPNTAGAHAGHVADLAMRIYGQTVAQLLDDPASDARQKHLCTYCHGTSPGDDADHGVTANLPAEVSANLARLWDTANPPALTDAVTYNAPAGTRTCQLSECHYNTTTPGWLSGVAATCTTCHNNGTNNGVLANSWPDIGAAGTGDHFAHYAALGAEFTAVYGANSVCLACHNTQQPATDFSNIVSLASHIDGDRYGDATIPVAFNDKSEGTTDTVGYTAGVTPNENNGTCANVSCHGGSTIGATPAWRDGTITTTTVTTAECGKCHQRVDGATNPLGTEYNDPRSGAHVDHDHGCAACHSAVPTNHYAGVATSALDNPDNIGNVTYSVEYTDTTTTAVNPLTNGWFNDATTAFGVSGTCATVTCHAGATPAWDVDLTATCGLCHLDSPTSNSHAAHVTAGATPDHTDCDQCHPSGTYAVAATGTDTNFLSPGLHADGTINLVAGIGASGSGGAVACATACHARETTTTWDNTAVPMSCNSCHYYAVAPAAAGNVGTAALGGTHNAHFFGAPTNIVCTDCHADNSADVNDKRTHMRNTGANDGAVLQNKAAAFQDEADVILAALGTGSDPDMAPIGVDLTSNPTCNTGLCHNPSPGAAYSATWSGAPNASCNFCHANTTGDPASGSHTKHIGYAAGYAPCTQCHVDNGTTYTHMDRNVDLAVTLTYSASLNPPYDNTSWGSCSAGACHDTDLDPAWGTAVPANSCGVCHINNNGAPLSSTDSPNFLGSDRAASHVGYGDEWTLRGHGARGLLCTSCHDGVATAHQPDLATSTNPFRLGPGYTTPDAFCSNTTTCHTGATVPGSNLVVSHTNELMTLDQRIWPAWDPKCVDCHDPHGDATNLKMVAIDMFDRGSSAHGVPTATVNGIPRTGDVIDFTVQGGIAAGSYADTTAGADGVCQECHLATDGIATGVLSFQDDNTVTALAGNHPTVGLSPCTQCHVHSKAFDVPGCYGCHGEAVAKQYWPNGAIAPNTAGAHAGHIADLARRVYNQSTAQLLADPAADTRQKHLCKYCHGPNPGSDVDHGQVANLPADVPDGGMHPIWDIADPPLTADDAIEVGKGTTRTCNNVDCHYNRTTPGWESGTAATCTTCHNNGTDNGALANAWPDVGTVSTGDHYAHYGALGAEFNSLYGATNTLCVPCHNTQQPATDFSNIVSLASHIDGDKIGDAAIAGAAGAYDDKSAGTPAYGAATADDTCVNVSCHGGITTPAWQTGNISTATVTNAECVKCHVREDGNTVPLGTEYNSARSGAHIDHDHGCEACHSVAPANHYAGIATISLDNPTGISNVGWSVEYTDNTTVSVNANTNGYFNDAMTSGGSSGTCATVNCHNNQATVAWDVDLSSSCNFCHLDTPTTNSHPAHVYGTPGTADLTDCNQCHPSATYAVAATGTDTNFISPGTHANLTIDKVAGIGASGSGGTVACATACHARETTTSWNNTTVPMSCNSCHYYAAAPSAAANIGAGALGGTHNAHFFGAPTNIVCTDCHADNSADVNDKRTHMRNTGANDGAVLQNKAAAFQDEADVILAALGTGSDPDMAPIGVDLTSNPTCNTGLCHNPSPGAAYSATWSGAPNASCNFCHANTTGDPASGSHTKHIGYAAGYAPCTQCHVDNGTTYTHMDRNVDLAVTLTYSASLNPPYDNTSWGSCSAGACHDTDLDPAWGTSVAANDCFRCHINNNGAPLSSTDSPNFSGSDRVASHVGYGDEWNLRGHGARGLTCTGCHDGATNSHQPDLATSTNPFRLGPGYTTPDAFCSNTTTCHTGATVPGSNLVTSHTNELMNLDQRTWPAWDPKCVDCHDPHGDTNNLKMVATDVFDRGSSTHGVPTATLNAIPRTADVVDFTVQGEIAVGSYADTTAGADGICQECHLATDGVATGIVSFQDDNAVALSGNHPTTSLSPCTQCHKHDKAFEPAGCYGCHGNAPAKQYWPDGAGGSPAYVDDSVGAHDNHVLAISQWLGYGDIATLLAAADTDVKQKTICSFCHPDPGGNGHSTNNGSGDHASTVDVWFDGMNNGGGAGNNFKAFKVGAGTYGDDAGAAQATYNNAAAAKTCSNVDCHNEYVTPVGWNTPPDWSALGPNSRCSNFSCHDSGSYSIAHTAHVADKLAVTAGNGYLCTECHLDNGVNFRHQNGRVDMLFTLAGTVDVQFGGGTVAYYDKDNGGTSSAGDTGFAYKDGVYARSCYNLYCHGADSTWSGADTTPVWNTPNTATCYGASTCHNAYGSPYDQGGVARNAITSGSHEVHMIQWTSAVGVEAANPVGPRMSPHPNSLAGSTQHSCSACHNVTQGVCTDCHDGITGSGASLPTLTHADGRVDFTGTITGPSPLTITAAAIATTDACDECHGGAAGAATAKGNWLSGTALACESCHGDNTAARSRRNIGWPAEASVDAPLRAGAIFDTSGHGKVTDNVTYGGSACVHCHNEVSQHFTQRTNTIAPALGDMNRLDVLGGNDYGSVPTAYCGTCHSGVTETVHYTNLRTAGGSSDDANQCVICHDPHGQAGQDAMVNGTIAGRSVTGFADKTAVASYFNGTNTGVCQVCHDPLEVRFHNRTSGAASTHSPNEVCTTCHKHEAAVAFEPRSCESCHNGAVPYVKGTATAPNVMGNGTSATGTDASTPKPYDDGGYGFNVNGHGRDDSPPVPGNPINVACSACHDIDVPTGTHLDGVVNGRLSPDTRNANSFHLLSAFVKTSPTSEHDVQVTFDNACYSTCHSGVTSDMRHALDAVPAVNAAQFGTHNSYQDPQNTPPPTMYYDKHLKTNVAYDGLPNFALCVSCHNPHGTNTTSPRADLNNKMVLYQWSSPAVLCAQCHP